MWKYLFEQLKYQRWKNIITITPPITKEEYSFMSFHYRYLSYQRDRLSGTIMRAYLCCITSNNVFFALYSWFSVIENILSFLSCYVMFSTSIQTSHAIDV